MLTEYPRHFSERFDMPPAAAPITACDALPDIIVANDTDETRMYLTALGWTVLGLIPNSRECFWRVRLQRGDEFDCILTGPADGLTIADVRGKVVCGHLPPLLAVEAKLLVVLEPDISPDDVHAVIGAPDLTRKHRLSAYRMHRASTGQQLPASSLESLKPYLWMFSDSFVL